MEYSAPTAAACSRNSSSSRCEWRQQQPQEQEQYGRDSLEWFRALRHDWRQSQSLRQRPLVPFCPFVVVGGVASVTTPPPMKNPSATTVAAAFAPASSSSSSSSIPPREEETTVLSANGTATTTTTTAPFAATPKRILTEDATIACATAITGSAGSIPIRITPVALIPVTTQSAGTSSNEIIPLPTLTSSGVPPPPPQQPLDSSSSSQPIVPPANNNNNTIHRIRLMEYYAKHNPAKLLDASGIEATLEKYKGREESLFSALHQKYEPIAFPNPPDDKDDTNNGPTVFLEFGGSSGGTVQIQLFAQATPVTVENFRCLCTGEIELPVASNSYTAEDRRPRLCFRHSLLHRIVPGMCVQGGDITVGDGTGGRSIYPPSAKNVLCHTTTKDAAAAAAVATPSSRNNIHKTQNSSSNNNSPVVRTDMWGNFDDEQPFLAHSTEGLLSMANNGPNRNNSQFFVTLKALPHLNGKHVVFGRVTCGMDVIRGIASDYAASISTSSTLAPPRVEIVDCGEIETHPDGTEIWHRASALDKEDSFREHDDNDTSYSHVDSVDSNSDTREETNESSTTATSTPSTRLDGSNSNTFAGACAAADDSVDSELVPCPSLVTHAAIHVKTGGGIIDVSIATGGITSELVCQIIPSTPCVASDSSDTTIALSNPCYNESKCKPVSGTFINDALLIEHNSSTDNVPETQGAPREDATGVSMPVQGTSGPKSTTGARNYAITASLHHDMDVVVVDTLKSAPTTNSEPSLGTLRLVDDPIIGLSLSPRIPSDSPLKQPITAPGLGTNRSKVLPSEPPEAAPTASTTSEPSDNTGTVACTSQFYNEIIESSSIGSPTRPTQSSDVSFAETDGSDAGNRSIATGDSSVVEQIENLHRELDTTREQLRLTHLKLDKQRESLMSRQDGRSGVRPPRFNKTLTPSPQRRDTHRLNAVDDSNSYSKKSHTELLPVAHITAPPDHPDTCGFNSIRRVEKSMSLEKDFIPDSEANTPCEIASLVDNSVDERTKLLERLEKDLRVACADHPSDDDYLIFMRRLQMLKTKLVSNKEQVDNGKTRAEETINPFCNVAETQECLFNVCELGMSIKTTDKDLATDLRLTHFKDEVSSVCHDGATQAQLTTNQEESVKACEPHTKNVSDIVIARHLPTKTDNIAVPLFLLPGREKRAHKVTENSTNNVHMSSCGSHKIMQRDVSHSIAPSHLSVLKEADAPASLVLNQKVPFGYGCLIATGEQKTRIKDAVQSQERRSQILYNYQKALSTRFLTKTGVNVAIPIVLPTHVTAGISLVASNAEKLCGPIAEDATYNSSLISNRQVHHDRALGSRNKDRVKKYGDHTVSSHKSSSISLYDYQQALSVRLSTTTRKSAKSTDPCILPANVDAGISLLVQDVTDVQEMLPMRELPIDDIRRYADSVNRQIEQPSDVKSLVARFEKWCNAQGTN